MSARACTIGLATLALVCGSAPRAFGFVMMDGPLIASLRSALVAELDAYNRKDVDGALKYIDSRSPDYEPTKEAMIEQFKTLDVKSELVSFEPMGHDNEFAVARVKMKTTGKPGSGFADNTVDAVMLFHQENGQWKMWSEQVLGVDLAPAP